MSQQYESLDNLNGNVKISEDVIATIAKVATLEVPGVAGMYSTFAGEIKGIIGKKSSTKGVEVEIKENSEVVINIYISVYYGKKIPEVAASVQETVLSNVQNMTGYTVQKVNVFVLGIVFEENNPQNA